MVEVIRPAGDISVIVIDDSANSCKKISDCLLKEGYSISCFQNPEDALNTMCEKGADLIILDDIIPICNGFKVLKKLKEKNETRAIPIIFISSLREIEEKSRAISLGADDCIVRPVNEYELLTRVRSLISISALKNEVLNRERLVSIGRLAGGVAHEINNPLTGVMTNLQLLRREVDRFARKFFEGLSEKHRFNNELKEFKSKFYSESGLKSKIDKLVAVAIDGGNRCSKVVGNLLEYSKPVKEDKIVPVQWEDVIEHSLALLRRMADENNISVNKVFEEKIPAVRCCLWEARQIVLSILMNAFQAVSESGEKNVDIRGYTEGRYVVLEIIDSGKGIEEDKVDSAFDFFYTSRSEGEGFGLGLSVVNQIVMKYGGKIGIETSKGKGTTIKVCLFPF